MSTKVHSPIPIGRDNMVPVPVAPSRENDESNSVCASRRGASPSSVPRQRSNSPVLVTTSGQMTAKHEFMEGRPRIVIPKILSKGRITSGSSTTSLESCTSPVATPTSSSDDGSGIDPTTPTAMTTMSTTTATMTMRRPKLFPSSPSKSKITRSATISTSSPSLAGVLNEPPPLRLEAWTEPPAEKFNVRGLSYMQDGKKISSLASAMRLLTADLIKCDGDTPILGGICSHPEERIQRALRRERETGNRQLPDFVFVVNLAVPGSTCYHMVQYFAIDNMEEIKTRSTPFGRLAYRFFFGESDTFRDRTLKMIPRIVDGNFIVKKAVGSKPAVLGRKIKQHYIRTDRFCEVIVDISSDGIAQRIVKVALGYTKTLTVDMAYVFEGEDEDTLPERIVGVIRLKGIDFKELDGQRIVKPWEDESC